MTKKFVVEFLRNERNRLLKENEELKEELNKLMRKRIKDVV